MIAVVLGGTSDHIRLINLLKSRSYTVYLIDYLPNPPAAHYADHHILESAMNNEVVLKICRELKASLCIATCIDQALPVAAYVSEAMGLPCHISYETSIALTNKVQMKERLTKHGITTSPYATYSSEEPNLTKINKLRFPIVVKPADANSSKGVHKVFEESELADALRESMQFSRTGQVILEEFKLGVELSVDVLISDFEPKFILITENRKRKDFLNKFVITQSLFDKNTHYKHLASVSEIAKSVARAYSLRDSAMLIQIVANGDELSVIEFSARIGGGSKCHLIPKLTGVDLLEAQVDIIHHVKCDIRTSLLCNFAAISYVYIKPGTFSSIQGMEELQAKGVVVEHYQYKPLGAKIQSSCSSTDRPLGFMVTADTLDDLQNKIKDVDKTLKVLNENGEDIMLHELY